MTRLVVSLWLLLAGTFALAGDRPNILWLSFEDISPHFGCYGDPHAITPNLDRLAGEGIRFTNAYTAAGVCAPCRSTIITGMYQNSIGTHHMRCNAGLPKWLKPFPILLREAGYHCINNSKTDYQFAIPKKSDIWDACSGRAHWKDRPADKPFFAVFNFTGCHESGITGEAKYKVITRDLTDLQRHDPARLTTLPPYYPDTPVVREDWKRNYELITAADAWAGKHIEALKQAGEYEDTIIMAWSDHGVGLPRAKRWLYDSGTRVPLIVRIPEKFRTGTQGKPGTIDEQLVNSTDFGLTVLNLAGVGVPDHAQGRAFLGSDLAPQRKYIFGARDRMDERYDIIRAVRDKRFRYIRNFEPLKPYYQYMNTPEKGATMREIRRMENSGKPMSDALATFSATRKPVEELYDLDADPHEVKNLLARHSPEGDGGAGNPAHAAKLAELRKALADWQFDIGDIGLLPESEIEVRQPRAGSAFEILAGNQDLIARLVEIATKASEGESAFPDLKSALEHEDAAIRYWGATGLGNFAGAAGKDAAIVNLLKARLDDPSPAVRIAAARALCRMGMTDPALEILGTELSGKHQWARLQAAIALDYLDETARPVLPQLQAALNNQPNKYIVRVANRAVNDLLETDNKVR